MNKERHFTFSALEDIDPPRRLSFAILSRIQRRKQHVARIKLALLTTSSLVSAILLFPVVSYTLTGFTNSGFYEYLSLIYSEGLSILPYWKEIGLSLAESLPTFELALLLAVVYALLESLKLAVKNAPVAFYQFR